MGGNAFNEISDDQQPLRIVRLEASEYVALRQRILEILQMHFGQCICPIEAPDKVDHGDIDILVAHPKHEYSINDLSDWLGGARHKQNGDLCHFAVPRPESQDVHVQVDVLLCKDNIEWYAFMHSYGDVWNILGTVLRAHGLTATNTGFYVRIEEEEKRNKKEARFFLSDDPRSVMIFLGLDADEYHQGIKTEQRLFEWLLHCRFVTATVFSRSPETADDRRRRARPMFARFVVWNAAQLDKVDSELQPSRDQTLAKALTYFGQEEIFQRKLQQVRREVSEDKARILIVTRLVSMGFKQDKANLVARGLKRWTSLEDQQLRVLDHAQMQQESQVQLADLLDTAGDGLQPQYMVWICDHCEHVKSLEKGRMKVAKSLRAGA